MKLIIALTFFTTLSFNLGASINDCISTEKAQQIVNQMQILVDTFDRADLVRNVEKKAGGYVTMTRGENEPVCEFEGQCESDVHHTLETGILEVFVTCAGESSYSFVNDVEHD